MTDGAGSESYGYDALDRLTAVTRGSDSFSYSYDAASNLTGRTYPGGAVITYGFDDDGRLNTTVVGGQTVAYTYDAAGNELTATLPNGCVEAHGYDRSGRTTSVENTCNSSTVSSFNYTLDPVGNPTSVATHEGTLSYGYDTSGRLTSHAGPGGPISWTYDPAGNRLTEARGVGTTSYSYNAADQLLSTSGPGGTVSYGFDANGNLTGDGSRSFVYDLANRLLSTTVGGQTITYTYDGDGKRLNATGATTTSYLWDPNAALALLAIERDGTGALLRRYSYGSDLFAMFAGGANRWYLHDRLGSVVNVASPSGSLEWSYSYEPYGPASSQTQNDPSAPANPIRFTGQLLDGATGLYHLRARDYDPVTGRFLQTDPLAQPPTESYLSAYTYADNKPTTLVDPSGLDATGNCWSPFCWLKTEGWKVAITAVGPGKFVKGGQLAIGFITRGYRALKGIRAAKGASKLVEGARYPLSPKIQGQLAQRGWTTDAIDEAVQSGKQVRAVNKATGDPATRYIHPNTGQSVVIDDTTGQVIHVGGPGFKYGPGSGDVP